MAMNANERAIQSSAKAMREAADKNFQAALSTNIAAIAGSVVSIGVTSGSLYNANKSWAANGTVAAAKLQAYSGIGSSIGTSVSSTGNIVGEGFKKSAGHLQADSTVAQGLASRMDKEYAVANEHRDTAREAKQAVLDFLRAKVQSEAEAEKNAARNL